MGHDDLIAGVTNTLLDYCQFVDEARVDEISKLFCEDATFDDGKPAVGHAKIMHRIKRLLASVEATSHNLTNMRIAQLPQPDIASASSYCHAWHQRSDGSQFELWIRYVDQLRLEHGRWRLQRRAVQCSGFRGIDSFPIPKVPRQSIA